jgi:DNA adenine methylase
MRELDRDKKKFNSLSNVKKASRILYLNKTCFNGLFRVNNFGEFNIPFFRYKNPHIVNESTLKAVHLYFNQSEITFASKDYENILKSLTKKSTFVYLDPPYDIHYPIHLVLQVIIKVDLIKKNSKGLKNVVMH